MTDCALLALLATAYLAGIYAIRLLFKLMEDW